MPSEIAAVVTVNVPGIYAFIRADVARSAERGDLRIAPELAPHLTDTERQALNDASHEVQTWRRRAEAMLRRETVTVSRKYGRQFRELTEQPWWPDCRWITVAADDEVQPANSGPLI